MLELLALAPPCAMFDTCQYLPNPVDGPLMPTWNVPEVYGGWTNMPVKCDVFSSRCEVWAPQG